MSKSSQYRVVVWGQKGQKSGTRTISKKPYDQLGSARKYAQKQSAVKSRAFVVHYVSLMQGNTEIERFKKGKIDSAFGKPPLQDPKGLIPKAIEYAKSNPGKYELEVRKHADGKIKWLPNASQYGLSKDEAKAIRDSVRDASTAPPLHPVDAATKRRKQQKRATPQKRQAVRDQLNMLQLDAATAEAAMSALLREKQAAVNAAQSDLEDTLARAAQIGVHASIA